MKRLTILILLGATLCAAASSCDDTADGDADADADVDGDADGDGDGDGDTDADGDADGDTDADGDGDGDGDSDADSDADRDADDDADRPSMAFPGVDWEARPPGEVDVDREALEAALGYLEEQCGSDGVTQTLVVRDGYLIWEGDDVDDLHNVWSVTKSFTSTVLGLLVDDGLCTVDTFAQVLVGSLASDYPDVTLRHFATMTSGYDAEGGAQTETPFDPTAPIFEPGAEFLYWDAAMNQFGNVLTRIADEPIEDLFARRVAALIGMDEESWDWGDWGTIDGIVVNGGAGNKSKGIHITARELARFGHLFLNRGVWDGTEVISASWVDQATAVQVPSTIPAHEPDVVTGVYGYNWWVNGVLESGVRRWPDAPDGTYMAVGHNGNYCVVVPEWRMVIVRLGVDGTQIAAEVWSRFFELLGDAL